MNERRWVESLCDGSRKRRVQMRLTEAREDT